MPHCPTVRSPAQALEGWAECLKQGCWLCEGSQPQPLPESQRCSADKGVFLSGSRRLCSGNTLYFGEGSQLTVVGK